MALTQVNIQLICSYYIHRSDNDSELTVRASIADQYPANSESWLQQVRGFRMSIERTV
jgi:hypothetical protein